MSSVTDIQNLEELVCRYDNRQSFYGKALVRHVNDGKIGDELYSYLTKVAWFEVQGDKCVLVIDGNTYWDSNTSLRHVKEFAQQHGLPKMNKRELSKFTIY